MVSDCQADAKNRGKPKWSFLDGPITANNPMGVHHAWGRSYKDAFQRYFAMTGHELRYQNGFDCQGLWVEVEVEKELGLRTKRDIEERGYRRDIGFYGWPLDPKHPCYTFESRKKGGA